jgi:hypothetical protein
VGHNRIRRLSASAAWQAVVELLDGAPQDPVQLAAQVVQAADRRLRRLAESEGLGYCFWVLTRIASASRLPGFEEEMKRLGLRVSADTTPFRFIILVADRVEARLATVANSGHFDDIAALALRAALTESIGRQGRDLLSEQAESLHAAVLAHATPSRFARLAVLFFGAFLSRTLRAILDRELAQHVGTTQAYATLADSRDFLRALDRHAQHAATVIDEFARGWYDAHHYQTEGQISAEEVRAFVAHALDKLRDGLKLQAAAA